MTPFFDPGPIEAPAPPIHLAGVAPPLLRLTGEVADGLAVHPLHTAAYLAEVIRPCLAEGARRAGRSADAVALSVPVFTITGRDAAERARAREEVRGRIAFYASTPSYEPVLAHHGLAGLRRDLSALAARGRWDEMPRLVPDELLREVAVDAEPGEIGAAVRARYAGLADRVTLSRPFTPGQDDRFWRETLRELRR
jgi:probable F420-dependent oxidoreductase